MPQDHQLMNDMWRALAEVDPPQSRWLAAERQISAMLLDAKDLDGDAARRQEKRLKPEALEALARVASTWGMGSGVHQPLAQVMEELGDDFADLLSFGLLRYTPATKTSGAPWTPIFVVITHRGFRLLRRHCEVSYRYAPAEVDARFDALRDAQREALPRSQPRTDLEPPRVPEIDRRPWYARLITAWRSPL